MDVKLILASASPRRVELLKQMGLAFTTRVADIDETPQGDELPGDYVVRLAREKARVVGQSQSSTAPPWAVIGADTAVVVEDRILGKPMDRQDGLAMLMALSGRVHTVFTAVAVYDGRTLRSTLVETHVTFRELDAAEARHYWDTGEGADKAGGYGIQGIGGIFVTQIEGSYSAVVGLPVEAMEALLKSFDIDTWSMRFDG